MSCDKGVSVGGVTFDDRKLKEKIIIRSLDLYASRFLWHLRISVISEVCPYQRTDSLEIIHILFIQVQSFNVPSVLTPQS